MESLFAEYKRWTYNSVVSRHAYMLRQLKLKKPLDPDASSTDIVKQLLKIRRTTDPKIGVDQSTDPKIGVDQSTVLWLNDECIVAPKCVTYYPNSVSSGICAPSMPPDVCDNNQRYEVQFIHHSGRMAEFAFFQLSATVPTGPVPAVEYFITKLAGDDNLRCLSIGLPNQ